MKTLKTIWIIGFVLGLISQTAFANDTNNVVGPYTGSKSIHIVSYNVENLFDTAHDEGKNDWGFTPKDVPGKWEACEAMSSRRYRQSCFRSDWNDSRYQIKLDKIKEALTANTQNLPDMLALIEIENVNVVRDLAKHLGYGQYHLTKSPDHRGIDVALLFNEREDLKSIEMKEYVVNNDDHFKTKPTRNILEVVFQVGGEHKVSVFVNHWPSQASPGAIRTKTAMVMKEAYETRLAENSNHHIIAMGDFNTIPEDRPHPFNSVILTGTNALSDVKNLYKASDIVTDEAKKKMPLGTYFYPRNMVWNDLDRFFVDTNLNDGKGLEVHAPSFEIYTKGITRNFEYDREDDYHYGSVITKTPKRYNHEADTMERAGFSDHFPISVRLTY